MCRYPWGSAVWNSDCLGEIWDAHNFLVLHIFVAARLLLRPGLYCGDLHRTGSDIDTVVSGESCSSIACTHKEDRFGQSYRRC